MVVDVDLAGSLASVVYYIVFHGTRALLAVLQSDSYLYWPFLVSTLVIVALVSRRRTASSIPSEAGAWRLFFSPKLWWHRSARADYRLYFANALLFPVLFVPLIFGGQQIVELLDAWMGRGAPATGDATAMTSVPARVLFTLLFFVAYDFGRFAAHCLLHDIPALWEFHKVHHSAQVLTLMTAYRAHPLELLIMAWVPALATGGVTWLFNLAGGGVTLYTFLGLHVVVWVFNLVDNLRHSPVWVSYGPVWGRWLVSPAHHQLHHSIEPRHWGCNRGSNLAIWDRLYGTLYVPGVQPESFRMGLGDGSDERWNSVWRMYLEPFAGCARKIAGVFRPK